MFSIYPSNTIQIIASGSGGNQLSRIEFKTENKITPPISTSNVFKNRQPSESSSWAREPIQTPSTTSSNTNSSQDCFSLLEISDNTLESNIEHKMEQKIVAMVEEVTMAHKDSLTLMTPGSHLCVFINMFTC